MSYVTDMSAGERDDLVQKLAGVIKTHEYQDIVNVNKVRTVICPLIADEVQERHEIKVCKKIILDTPITSKDKVDAFRSEARKAVEGIHETKIEIETQHGVGTVEEKVGNGEFATLAKNDYVPINVKDNGVSFVYIWDHTDAESVAAVKMLEDLVKKR